MILVCQRFTRDSIVSTLATGLPWRAVSGPVVFIFDLFDLECVVVTVFQALSFFPTYFSSFQMRICR